MAAIAVLVVLGLIVVVPALVAAVVLIATGRSAVDPVRAARRHDTLITLSTMLAALLTAIGVLSLPVTWTSTYLPTPTVPGALLAAGPFAVAVVACLVRIVGELTWPRPSGAVRTAPLRRRTVRELAGLRLHVLAGTSLLLVAAVVIAGATASDGTSIRRQDADLGFSTSAGPYPGWPYGIPIVLGLAAALCGTILALRVIARRAPLDGQGHDADDLLRRRSVARLLGVVQVCVGGATALVLVTIGGAWQSIGTNPVGYASEATIDAGTAVLVLALAVALLTATTALWPVTAAHSRPVVPSGTATGTR